MNEDVMVVPRPDLQQWLDQCPFGLIRGDNTPILDVITNRHQFMARTAAEESPDFKQIIPYVVIRHDQSFFLLKRTTKQAEARLHHKMSLGIGGHINPDTPTVLGGLKKELEEEVAVRSEYTLRFIGILNDDTTDVGRVHLGAVYVLQPQEPLVTVLETDKMSGAWTHRTQLASFRVAMETWSQIVYDQYIAK
jgi:predicted NUDIX family phosphoesterase